MKKNYLLLGLLVGLILFALMACSSDSNNENESLPFQLRNFANTGCKSHTRADGESFESYEYKCMNDGFLSLKHANALYNCGAENFNMEATISGNEIKVYETASLDPENMMDCICTYDLSCEVGPLEEGVEYTFYTYQLGSGLARFVVTFKKGTSGSYQINYDELCSTPWW